MNIAEVEAAISWRHRAAAPDAASGWLTPDGAPPGAGRALQPFLCDHWGITSVGLDALIVGDDAAMGPEGSAPTPFRIADLLSLAV